MRKVSLHEIVEGGKRGSLQRIVKLKQYYYNTPIVLLSFTTVIKLKFEHLKSFKYNYNQVSSSQVCSN